MKKEQPSLTSLLRQGCERPWEVAVAPFCVAPRTYYVGNSWVGAYLIDTRDGLILIDATMQPQVYLLFESIRQLGFDPRDIRLLLISHGHYDHCGGARAVQEMTGAQLYMAREDETFIEENPTMLFSENYPFGSFHVDRYFSDDQPVVLGDVSITTVHTPGHTPGTTSFFFETAGDDGTGYRCGLHGGIGVNTLTDEYLETHHIPLSVRNDFLNGLLKVRDVHVDITLGSHPGHVDMLDKVTRIDADDNPFVDAKVWPDLMESRIRAIKALIDGEQR